MKRASVHFLIMSLLFALGFAFSTNAQAFEFNTDNSNDFSLISESFSSSETQIHFSLNDFDVDSINVDGRTYSIFSLDGAQSIQETGLPDLPSISKLVLIPPQSGVELILTNCVTTRIADITPCPVLSLESDGSNQNFFFNDNFVNLSSSKSDPAFLGSDGFFPPFQAEIQPPAILRGYRIVKLTINPLRWNPITGDLEILRSADFELNFNTYSNQTNIITDPNRSRPSRFVNKILEGMGIDSNSPARDDNFTGGSIAFIIGEWDDVFDALQPLVEWKRRMGWSAEIIRVRRNDRRTDIHDAIQDAYDNWEIPPEYVVLVGDAPGHEGNNYTLAYWNEQNGSNYAYETDHHYAELEGNDILPEAAVGRLVFDSIDMLQTQINKIIQYESNPYIAEGAHAGWQLKAAVAATDSRSGGSTINLCKWFKDLAVGHGFTNVSELYFSNNSPQPDPTDFLLNAMTRGISFLLYRGWADMNGFEPRDINQYRNGGMLPFVMLATCNTGEYATGSPWSYSEAFAIRENGGAIGCVGTSGATHTAYNNNIASSTLRAMFNEGITSQGWALMQGKMSLYANYAGRGDIMHRENNNMEAWLTHVYIYNLMGDPSVELFTDVPSELIVNHPDFLRPGETYLEVEVLNTSDNTPNSDARVCLYYPGEFQLVSATDGDGKCGFVLDGNWLDRGIVQLTITGTNIKPYLADLDILPDEGFIGVSSFMINDDHFGLSNGNSDGLASSNEMIELSVRITNYNIDNLGDEMTAVLSSLSPNVNVLVGEAGFTSIPDRGESRNGQFLIKIEDKVREESSVDLELIVATADDNWTSRFTLPLGSAVIKPFGVEWIDDPLAPGDSARLKINLQNLGNIISTEMDAKVYSQHPLIQVLQRDTRFGQIMPGSIGQSRDTLVISADERLPIGSAVGLMILLENYCGFQDTMTLQLNVNSNLETLPFGPDNYGYYCIDDADQSSSNHPDYEWIEIDPDQDGQGNDTNLEDVAEDDDQSIVVDLPFSFKYYGQEFGQITICTNGWVALGDHSNVNSARNRHILNGETPPAMICPFWDDLITTNNGGIYYWFNRDEHYFVVEWSQMRKLGPRRNNEPEESFQVILYDPEFHETPTGDGDILFQYLQVTDNRSCYQNWDTPYATVGMVSPDLRNGLEYTYWGQLHEGAPPLVPERAVLMTTRYPYESGTIQGTVTDGGNDQPISDVRITTSSGFYCLTDENGHFRMAGLLIADNYTITAAKGAYGDTTITDISIDPDEEVQLALSLLKPEFRLSRSDLNLETLPDSIKNATVILENPGSQTMYYQSHVAFGWEDTLDTWYPLLTWPVSDIIGDTELHGITFTGADWLISGGSNGTDENWFYRFGSGGLYRDRIAQPLASVNGIRDMEFFDEFLYGVYWSSYIKKIDPQTGEEIIRLDVPNECTNLRGLTIDPETGKFYISCRNGIIYALELIGEDSLAIIDTIELIDPRDSQIANRCNSLSWLADDADGFNLYVTSDHDPDVNDQRPSLSVYKINTVSHKIRFLTDLPTLDESFTFDGGTCITSQWDTQLTVFAGIFDGPDGDIAAIFALKPQVSWLSYEPAIDTLDASESREISFSIDPTELDLGVHYTSIEFHHNAEFGITRLPIEISVTEVLSSGSIFQPTAFQLQQNFPNPFNAVTEISFSLATPGMTQLTIFDLQGRLVAEPVNGNLDAGNHTFRFNGKNLASGLYIYRLDYAGHQLVKKAVLLR